MSNASVGAGRLIVVVLISRGLAGMPLQRWIASQQHDTAAIQRRFDVRQRTPLEAELRPAPSLRPYFDTQIEERLVDLRGVQPYRTGTLPITADQPALRHAVVERDVDVGYGRKFLDLARSRPATPTAAQALLVACALLKESEAADDRQRFLDAVSQLHRDHLQDTLISETTLTLSGLPSAKTIDLHRAILAQSQDGSARAAACNSLATDLPARSLRRGINLVENLIDEQPECVILLHRAFKEFGVTTRLPRQHELPRSMVQISYQATDEDYWNFGVPR